MASARPVDEGSLAARFEPVAPVPPRKINGGLYVGEPFAGPWGNVPIEPDAGAIAARREFLAWYQAAALAGGRPGNDAPARVDAPTREFKAYGVVAPDSPVPGAPAPPRG